MGQEQQEHTWDLIAKKISGEATTDELKELEELLRAHPELFYPLTTIADFWKSTNPGNRRQAEEASQAFDRHLERMKTQGVGLEPRATGTTTETRLTGATAAIGSTAETTTTDQPVWEPDERPKSRSRRLLLITPLLLLTLITVLLVYRSSHSQPPAPTHAGEGEKEFSEVVTHNGSRTNLLLPDGTRVWLNAGSRLTYEKTYGAQSREVSLTGEALFDVAHNATRPFIIHAAHVDIRVLGTRFNLKSYPSDRTTETTLLKGSIEVSIKDRPNEKIILKPNEKLVVANDDSTLHRRDPAVYQPQRTESLVNIRKPGYDSITGINVETSWIEDRLIFQDEAFGNLSKDMERWYGVNIHFTRPELEDLHFTGNFQKETIREALAALQLTAPFTYTIHENQITIYEK
ncbi:FecR family protein [Puia sp. P3]|uniref:FecR family protein n=1 Tax=Puia sp. P3 TaxID=3423952 RepID=UPI003D668A90